jgi:hypothetical protein
MMRYLICLRLDILEVYCIRNAVNGALVAYTKAVEIFRHRDRGQP